MSTDQATPGSRQAADPLLERLRLATLGAYDIAGELGRGGMAVVYVARDLKLERTVAIKVMDPRLSLTHGMAERFLQEARIAARLQHPNVIVVHDVQKSEDIIFFVMGLIEGGSIDELVRRPGPLPIDQVRWVLMQAARALAYAHSEGIVHRDVKPANILLNLKGEVILTDFGIAKAVGGDGLTQSGTQIGTPVYMSPEQFSGSPVGPSSDQYALGVTAYQMITGAPPFGGELYALIAAHGTKAPVPIRDRRPDCPAFLANAVMRMLEKEPENRWPSLDDLVEVLGASMAMDGGAARKSLVVIARELRQERIHAVPALTAITPISPIPTNSHVRRPLGARPESVMLTISPPAATIFAGGVLELKATVSLENGDTLPGAGVSWSSSDPAVVTVADGGSIRGIAPGTASVRATVGDATTDAAIRVESAPLARVVVNTPTMRLLVGDTVKPSVSVFDVTGQRRADVSPTFESGAPTVFEVDGSGLLRALIPGNGLVHVSVGALRRTIEVIVERRPIALLRIRTARLSLELGEAAALALEAFDDKGRQVAPPPVQWTSDHPSVVHVDSMGTVLAIAAGTATITVAVDDAIDTLLLEATESPIGTLEAHLAESDLLVGETTVLTMRVLDAFGAERSTAGVHGISASPEVALVDLSSLTIQAVGAGDAELVFSAQPPIAATAIEQRLRVRVAPRLAVRLEATPPVLDVMQGDSATITVRVFDRRGREIPAAIVQWESDAPGVAVAEMGGAVHTIHAGSALLHASCQNEDGTLVDVRIPVRVRAVSVRAPVLATVVTSPDGALTKMPSSGTASSTESVPASRATAAATAAPAAARRSPLVAGVAVVAVALIGWLAWPSAADRGRDATVPEDSVRISAPAGTDVDSASNAPIVAADPSPDSVAPEAVPSGASVAPIGPPAASTTIERGAAAAPKQSPLSSTRAGGRAIDLPGKAGKLPPGTATRDDKAAAPVATPSPAAEPVVAEPVAEAPNQSDLQREAILCVQELLRTRGARTVIADFWSDGARHDVELVGAARSLGAKGGETQAQFTIRLAKFNSGGRTDRFTSQVTLGVSKQHGRVSASAARFEALIPFKK